MRLKAFINFPTIKLWVNMVDADGIEPFVNKSGFFMPFVQSRAVHFTHWFFFIPYST
ncbi:MAG: hypothetical protein K0S60_10 [Evtepia sp.]|nr:hypothetical protein [Evtepia sp.]